MAMLADGEARIKEAFRLPIRKGPSTDPRAYVLSVNAHRRHLTAAEKRETIARLLKADPARSDRATSKITNVDHKTVASVRNELEGRGEIPHVSTRGDAAGRQQPVRRAPPAAVVHRSSPPPPVTVQAPAPAPGPAPALPPRPEPPPTFAERLFSALEGRGGLAEIVAEIERGLPVDLTPEAKGALADALVADIALRQRLLAALRPPPPPRPRPAPQDEKF
jgi:hypothetical protein